MRVTKNSFIHFLSYFILFVIILELVITCGTYLFAYNSSKKCYGNPDTELLRVKIYGSSTNSENETVSGTFSVIDSNGNEIAVIERSWSGSYLSLDFSRIKLNNQFYIFPKRIYGKERIFDIKKSERKGTDLSKYFNENGQCLLLGYGSSLKQRRALYAISKFALRKIPAIDFLKKTTVLSIDLSGCKTGYYYSVSTTRNGDLLVQEL